MSVCLLLIHDGRREELDRCMASALQQLPAMDQVVWVDDTEHELGFAGAIQHGWEQVRTTHVFHLEQDFVLTDRVDVEAMIRLLTARPELAQIVLKRQPWNEHEIAAGGIIEQHPDDYVQREQLLGRACPRVVWTEHRRFWSTNPSVYPAHWCLLGWPQEPESEGMFTHKLLRDPGLRFAFWGGKHDPPRVEHIGAVRAGHGY